jgi:hypothetical protein
MGKNKPRLETEDMFGNKVVAGNMVMFARKRGLTVGIFIRQNASTASVAVKEAFYGRLPTGGYGKTREFILIQANELFLIDDPIARLNSRVVRDVLEIVPDLKTGRHLSKDFDERIAWGWSGEDEEEAKA